MPRGSQKKRVLESNVTTCHGFPKAVTCDGIRPGLGTWAVSISVASADLQSSTLEDGQTKILLLRASTHISVIHFFCFPCPAFFLRVSISGYSQTPYLVEGLEFLILMPPYPKQDYKYVPPCSLGNARLYNAR